MYLSRTASATHRRSGSNRDLTKLGSALAPVEELESIDRDDAVVFGCLSHFHPVRSGHGDPDDLTRAVDHWRPAGPPDNGRVRQDATNSSDWTETHDQPRLIRVLLPLLLPTLLRTLLSPTSAIRGPRKPLFPPEEPCRTRLLNRSKPPKHPRPRPVADAGPSRLRARVPQQLPDPEDGGHEAAPRARGARLGAFGSEDK
jgi:hypothetical protein